MMLSKTAPITANTTVEKAAEVEVETKPEIEPESALDAVVTTAEAAELFGAREDTIRDACQYGYIAARKSGKTWLMLKHDAAKRWSKMTVLEAINVLARNDKDRFMDALQVITCAVYDETEIDFDIKYDGFGDWIAAGMWRAAKTEQDATKQINRSLPPRNSGTN